MWVEFADLQVVAMQSLEPHQTAYESDGPNHDADDDLGDSTNVHRARGSQRAGAGVGVADGLDIGGGGRWGRRALERIASHPPSRAKARKGPLVLRLPEPYAAYAFM